MASIAGPAQAARVETVSFDDTQVLATLPGQLGTGAQVQFDKLGFGGISPSVAELKSASVSLTSSIKQTSTIDDPDFDGANVTNSTFPGLTAPGVFAAALLPTQSTHTDGTSSSASVSATTPFSFGGVAVPAANLAAYKQPLVFVTLRGDLQDTLSDPFSTDTYTVEWSGQAAVTYTYDLYSQPSFNSATSLNPTLTLDFGKVQRGAPPPSLQFQVFNLVDNDPFSDDRHAMNVGAITPLDGVQPFSVLESEALISPGARETGAVTLDDSHRGSFSGRYMLSFPDFTGDSTLGPIRFVTLTVKAAVVPEPETWAAMLLGLTCLGAALRRRTASAAALS
jgi:hypothetical protein